MDTATREELRILRARAYGPQADIHQDPAALQRLQELEGRNGSPGHTSGTAATAADAPAAPTTASRNHAGMSSSAPPAGASTPAGEDPRNAGATSAPAQPARAQAKPRKTGFRRTTTPSPSTTGRNFAPAEVEDDAARASGLSPAPGAAAAVGRYSHPDLAPTAGTLAASTPAAGTPAAGTPAAGTPAATPGTGTPERPARDDSADSYPADADPTTLDPTAPGHPGAPSDPDGPDGPDHAAPASRFRVSPLAAVLWIASVLAAAAIAAGATFAAVSMVPVPASNGAPQIATLEADELIEIPPSWFGAGPSSRAFEFYGLTLFESQYGYGYGSAGTDCFSVVPTEQLPEPDADLNAMSMQGPVYSSCGVGAFPATVEVGVDSSMPEELRNAFPEDSAIQFVFDGERIGVFLDTP